MVSDKYIYSSYHNFGILLLTNQASVSETHHVRYAQQWAMYHQGNLTALCSLGSRRKNAMMAGKQLAVQSISGITPLGAPFSYLLSK